jgi:UDP-glucose 6-dehydrogenase
MARICNIKERGVVFSIVQYSSVVRTGACLADVGNHVLCLDVDERKIAKLGRGGFPALDQVSDSERLSREAVTQFILAFV